MLLLILYKLKIDITLLGHTTPIRSLVAFHNGSLVSGGFREILFWDTKSGRQIKKLAGHDAPTFSLAVLQDGSLAIGSFKEIFIWNTEKNQLIKTLIGHTNEVTSMVSLKNGYFASCSGSDIFIWDIKNWKIIRMLKDKNISSNKFLFYSLVVLNNGNLASAGRHTKIQIWNTTTGDIKRILYGHVQWVYSLAVLHDGNLASGSYDKTIRIWNTNTGERLNTLIGHTSEIRSLAVTTEGSLASIGLTYRAPQEILIWDTRTSQMIEKITGYTYSPPKLYALEDGRLAYTSFNFTISIIYVTNYSNINNSTTKNTIKKLTTKTVDNIDLFLQTLQQKQWKVGSLLFGRND